MTNIPFSHSNIFPQFLSVYINITQKWLDLQIKTETKKYYWVPIFVQLMSAYSICCRINSQSLQDSQWTNKDYNLDPPVPKAGLKNEVQVCNHLHLCCGPGHHRKRKQYSLKVKNSTKMYSVISSS